MAPAAATRAQPRLRLVALSFLMLFVELALIRWSGSNVIYLSYFSNFVLLGSFLGIGLGFLRAGARRSLFPLAPIALSLLVAFVRLFPVEIDRGGSELIFFGGDPTGLPLWVTLPVIFVAVAGVMATIADGVARTFARFEPLEAYRLDILGSIAGIAGFSLLSFLRAPPVAWGAVAATMMAALGWPRRLGVLPVAQGLALVGLVAVLAVESLHPGDSWSPYYKVQVEDTARGTIIDVNGIGHQQMTTVAFEREQASAYVKPYEHLRRPPRDVLIVGAGSGTDVAIALAEGATHVDAVEIDPRLYEIGAESHPERPYDDPRVDVHIDDGRAYLERNQGRWDLILFALPDSLTLVSGQSSLRLESYLFTREAMEEAKEHLEPGGAFAMYNYYREEWLVDRLAGTLQEVYGQPPCMDSGADVLRAMVVSGHAGALTCEQTWVATSGAVPEPATDDYPFVYLREPGVPGFYLGTIAAILVATLALTRLAAGPLRRMARYTDLFFMGAAFLLLETKNVVQFALLFGTTWFVNALVFAGVLLSVLAAVEIARRVLLPPPAVLYALLLAALVLAWAVPPQRLLNLSTLPRFAVAVAVAFAPILLANLIFAQRFKDVGSSTVAFGANLLGAMVGGLLEYASLVVGYRALLGAVALLYGLAYAAARRHLSALRPVALVP